MDAQQRIKDQVTGNPVVLYMKGTPQMPQCGFSAMAVQVLQACRNVCDNSPRSQGKDGR